MARSALRARLAWGTTCAASLYVSALLIAACTDAARSPVAPQAKVTAHGPRRMEDDCNDYEACSCDSDTAIESCGDSGGGGSDDGGDYVTVPDDNSDDNSGSCSMSTSRTHCGTEQNFDSTQNRMMDSVFHHIDSVNCGWVQSYLNNLWWNGANGTAGNSRSGSFFGTATGGWPPDVPGDTHTSSTLGSGSPDYNARIHIKPGAFGIPSQLTKTVIHEAAHGAWGLEDPVDSNGYPIPPSDPRYSAPGTPEGWANACYKP